MKRGYCKMLYNQRNKKDETIISVIKRLFGEHITSRLVRTQNRELSFRCIAYDTHRLTNLTIITWFLQNLVTELSKNSLEKCIFQTDFVNLTSSSYKSKKNEIRHQMEQYMIGVSEEDVKILTLEEIPPSLELLQIT